MSTRRIRIGIDVGGTFTHAVAIDADTLALVGKAKRPTTHRGDEGVARGVVSVLSDLLAGARISPADVVVVAHSTTQATNALLEGDVAPVGVVSMGRGWGMLLAKRQTALKSIPLSAGRELAIHTWFLHADRVDERTVGGALDELVDAGARAIVAAEAFSVDDNRGEEFVCELAAARGLPATATSRVSRLHGLAMRTRTAVINASMLPTMLATADRTEQAVRAAGIAAPLMIMRSDGGVMDVAEMRRRPILTMLSGPAAGVAAAMMHARVSDGVFIEVGGTSTDVSVIKNGRCQVRSAEVGGRKLHVSTLDVRTVGAAGGSLAACEGKTITAVGPRSAHIAGLPYLCFAEAAPESLAASSLADEGERFLTVDSAQERLAVTPTCASFRLGLNPEGTCASGQRDAIRQGFDRLAAACDLPDGDAVAERILRMACATIARQVEGLICDYALDRGVVQLVGGGGGAGAIVPYLARRMGLPCTIVENADVISAIGVALALVRDTVERTIISPSEEDIRAIRADARESILRMGAAAETIEVFVEVDARLNLLRATAQGSTHIEERELRQEPLDERARQTLVTRSIGAATAPPTLALRSAGFDVWTAPILVTRLWRLVKESRTAVRVLDAAGTIRWASDDGDVTESNVAAAEADLVAFAETYTRYSDAGARIPRCYALLDGRVLDFAGLAAMSQVCELLRMELQGRPNDEACVLLVDLGGAT